ncbi:unnamed protein product [Protopolystoma xenopodis]|uniref:Uncharacterized protein n=1 Tax=Protopolystoma xenopodis TaxID=117903 RepID=A0A3S5A7L8_9PLAT|nr:unnamed protein product [Protopolystoma xenopodis]
MISGADDVSHRTDESSAWSHWGLKTMGRGLLRTIQQIPAISVWIITLDGRLTCGYRSPHHRSTCAPDNSHGQALTSWTMSTVSQLALVSAASIVLLYLIPAGMPNLEIIMHVIGSG